jgi:hypothetical protein
MTADTLSAPANASLSFVLLFIIWQTPDLLLKVLSSSIHELEIRENAAITSVSI